MGMVTVTRSVSVPRSSTCTAPAETAPTGMACQMIISLLHSTDTHRLLRSGVRVVVHRCLDVRVPQEERSLVDVVVPQHYGPGFLPQLVDRLLNSGQRFRALDLIVPEPPAKPREGDVQTATLRTGLTNGQRDFRAHDEFLALTELFAIPFELRDDLFLDRDIGVATAGLRFKAIGVPDRDDPVVEIQLGDLEFVRFVGPEA